MLCLYFCRHRPTFLHSPIVCLWLLPLLLITSVDISVGTARFDSMMSPRPCARHVIARVVLFVFTQNQILMPEHQCAFFINGNERSDPLVCHCGARKAVSSSFQTVLKYFLAQVQRRNMKILTSLRVFRGEF